MLESEIYQESLIGVVVDEVHCVTEWGSSTFFLSSKQSILFFILLFFRKYHCPENNEDNRRFYYFEQLCDSQCSERGEVWRSQLGPEKSGTLRS